MATNTIGSDRGAGAVDPDSDGVTMGVAVEVGRMTEGAVA